MNYTHEDFENIRDDLRTVFDTMQKAIYSGEQLTVEQWNNIDVLYNRSQDHLINLSIDARYGGAA